METIDKIWLTVVILWLLLAIAFITLKLLKVVAWSWLVTLLPVIAFVVAVVGLAVFALFVGSKIGPQ